MRGLISVLSVATVARAFEDDGCSQEGFSAGGAAQGYFMKEAAKKDGAVCLDGTPGLYYLQQGFGDGADKWYIHHEGGGWCESLDDCVDRSKGRLGSTKSDSETASLGGGYFSTDASQNPMMYNWNHAKMRYCDGASFSGNNDNASSHKGTKLYWRGNRIREAIAHDIFVNRGMSRATDLVVSGCSAGGLATFLHTDQWCDALKAYNPSAKCVGLPDSGFFLDYQDPQVTCQHGSAEEGRLGTTINGNYHCGLKWTFAVQNATAGINSDCVAAHGGEEWKCMFAEHSSEHIRSPLFAMQSQYDSWQTGHVQGNGGAAKTQELGDNITARIQSMLMANNKESGAFLDSCHHHCGSWNSISIDGDVISDAFQTWYTGIGTPGSKKLWNQNKAYPCNACCSPGHDGVNIWKQGVNPVTNRSVALEYQPLDVAYRADFGGLEYNGAGQSLLDGNVNMPTWWYAVGSTGKFNGGIPGPTIAGQNTQQQVVELYVRTVDDKDWVLMLRQTDGQFFQKDEFAKNKNTKDNSIYAALDELEEYRMEDGTFKFKLQWPEATLVV